MNAELKQIKKLYGEKFSHLCRDLFSTILENNEMLNEILLENFEPNHFLYDDLIKNNLIEAFKNYIYNQYHDKLNNSSKIKREKIKETPEELMEKAGYILKECKTEEEVQVYKKYYADGEELCTFRNHRLDSCRVFFAVKKNALEIKRENFKTPRRQDEYGTSVISIQFAKTPANTLSIKNRYNHTVDNPDSTFSNDLDNIIAGLTESFENTYGIRQKYKNDNFEIRNYVRASDGKFYKYNYEINDIHYCPNNTIIKNYEVKKYDKEKYIVLDYFVLDLVNKKIYIIDNMLEDSFVNGLSNISKINVLNDENNRRITIVPKTGENIEILINNHNQIIGYKNNNIKKIGNNFLCNNNSIKSVELKKLKNVGDNFIAENECLEYIDCSNIQIVGKCFLVFNEKLKYVYFPFLQKVGNSFLKYSKIEEIELPSLEKVRTSFLSCNKVLKKFVANNLQIIDIGFLHCNEVLIEMQCEDLSDYKNCMNEYIYSIYLRSKQKVLKK